jgi:hypothetical protein|tara:strand:+ start:18 stop:710 length:693 start_codon:yes stop_codon:yes gene_type:complete
MFKAINIKLFKTNINSILLILIFCLLILSFISATKLSKINITTLDIINFDPKSVHSLSLDIQSFNPKSLHMQSLDIKNLDMESLNIKVFDIESLSTETLDIEDSDLKRSYLRSIDLYKPDINADPNIPDLNIDNYNINLYNLLSELIDSRSISSDDLKKIALSGFFETTLGKTHLERFKTADNGSLFEQYKIIIGKKPIYTTTEGFDVLVNPIGCTNNSCDKSIKFIKFY